MILSGFPYITILVRLYVHDFPINVWSTYLFVIFPLTSLSYRFYGAISCIRYFAKREITLPVFRLSRKVKTRLTKGADTKYFYRGHEIFVPSSVKISLFRPVYFVLSCLRPREKQWKHEMAEITHYSF